MSKGPSGSTTQTSVNPTQQAQLPQLQFGWNEAQNLYKNNPQQYYPGQTLADFRAPNQFVGDAYNQIYNTGQGLNAFLPGYNSAYNSAIGGGMGGAASPAYPYYQQYAAGQSGPSQYYRSVEDLSTNAGNQYATDISGYANQAAANNNVGLNALGTTAAGGGLGMQQLGQTASGYYLNSNPYIDQTYAAAARPVTQNFQTAIAPQLDYGFANSGRYGSGAQAAAQGNAQQNLGRTLGDLSTNIYGQNYARERQAQDAAAQNYTALGNQAGNSYGQLYNQGLGIGITGNQAAGQVYDQGLRTALTAAQQDAAAQQYGITGLTSGFNTGNAAQMAALGMFPQFASAQMAPANATLQAGQGLSSIDQTYRAFEQAQMDDAAKRYYGQQTAPYTTLDAFMKNIGSPTSGSGTVTNPYFSNPVANVLGAGLGATGIAKNLGKLGGGGAAGGLGEGVAADFGGIGIAPLTGASSVGTAAASGGLASLLPAAAAWIVCTELMRQGRLPKRHWAAGVRAFDAYPEIGKRGYYVWAIPSVRHLRRHPGSIYSRFLAAVFRWRAEDIAARAGIKGARRLWRGRAVTAALVPPCLVLGALAGEQDWQSVYRETAA